MRQLGVANHAKGDLQSMEWLDQRPAPSARLGGAPTLLAGPIWQDGLGSLTNEVGATLAKTLACAGRLTTTEGGSAKSIHGEKTSLSQPNTGCRPGATSTISMALGGLVSQPLESGRAHFGREPIVVVGNG